MATYREIHGKAVKSLDTDPSAETDAGQIWYNTDSNTFKSIVNIEAWISSANMSESRQNVEGAGTQTAGLAINGATGPGTPTFLGNSSEYNGTGWAAPVSTNVTAISKATFGTQTAAVATGGYSTSDTTINTAEEYNGSSWTAVTAMPQATRGAMGMGAENSGLVVGGESSTAVITNTQEYNGSSWATGGVIPTGTYNAAANGTSESNSWFAGGADSFKNTSFLYNGSAWTAGGNLNTARDQAGGAGIQTAALAFGGRVPPNTVSNVTENFDGSSWTTSSATLGTAAKQAAAFGTNTAAVFAGNDPASAITQEFNSSTNVITAAAWASGGNLPGARYANSGCGTQTAAICVGGGDPEMNTVDKYDGTSWSNTTSIPGTRRNMAVFGTQSATGAGQGFASAPSVTATYFEFNGSSWSAEESVPYSAFGSAGLGTTAAGLVTGGNPGAVTTCAEYGGESWTGGGAISNGRWYVNGSGTQTAGLIFGGDSPGASNSTEEYNGSSWTAGGNLLTALRGIFPSTAGTQTATLCAGGSVDPPAKNQSSTYDGSAWSTAPNLSTAREIGAGGGDSTTGLVAGGLTAPGPATNATEQFTGETTAVNVKTLTQS